jgi:hypothetical protein
MPSNHSAPEQYSFYEQSTCNYKPHINNISEQQEAISLEYGE